MLTAATRAARVTQLKAACAEALKAWKAKPDGAKPVAPQVRVKTCNDKAVADAVVKLLSQPWQDPDAAPPAPKPAAGGG